MKRRNSPEKGPTYGLGAVFAEAYYRLFWKECGTRNKLSLDEKVSLIRQVSDLSLRRAYWQLGEGDKVDGKTLTELFPELIPARLCPDNHIHLTQLNGLMLYVIHTELFSEVKGLAESGGLSEVQLDVLAGRVAA